MPRDILHELLGADHPSRAGPGGLERHRRLLSRPHLGSRAVHFVDRLEQLGHDEGDLQQETRSGLSHVHPRINAFDRPVLSK